MVPRAAWFGGIRFFGVSVVDPGAFRDPNVREFV
jgi:hypothetical protein